MWVYFINPLYDEGKPFIITKRCPKKNPISAYASIVAVKDSISVVLAYQLVYIQKSFKMFSFINI